MKSREGAAEDAGITEIQMRGEEEGCVTTRRE